MQNTTEMPKFNTYICDQTKKEVIIIMIDDEDYEEYEKLCTQTNDDRGLLPIESITEEILELLQTNSDIYLDDGSFGLPCYDDTDSFDLVGEEIGSYTITNVENEQHLISEFVTTDLAMCDEFERMCRTHTTQYHDWTSELTSFIDDIRNSLEENNPKITKKLVQNWKKEWSQIEHQYQKQKEYFDKYDVYEFSIVDQIKSELDLHF